MISIIIPVLDEEAQLGPCLDRLAAFRDRAEVIVCDGGSSDGTVRQVEARPWVRLTVSPRPGRGLQMNVGAEAAVGTTLLFLHADTELPPDAPDSIERALADPRTCGGGFRKRHRESPPLLALMDWGLNEVRAGLFGDLVGTNAIFLRTVLFRSLGGYRDWPLLEDVELSDRLKAAGRTVLLDSCVTVSPRKYVREGTLRRILINARVMAGYRLLGQPPAHLASIYRRTHRRPGPTARISVIVPALDEEEVIGACLASAARPGVELIVVDGGSEDGTRAAVERCPGARFLEAGNQCRAGQMNAGAAEATGDWLLFLHADTVLPEGWERMVAELATRGTGHAVGAFDIELDGEGWSLRLIEAVSNLRNRLLGLPYGDQALFVERRAFAEAGGFPDQSFLEDLEMARRLRHRGPIEFVPGARVRTSARRFARVGPLRLAALNAAVALLYLAGASAAPLGRWYRALTGLATET